MPAFDDWYWVMVYPGIKVSTAISKGYPPKTIRTIKLTLLIMVVIYLIYSCLSYTTTKTLPQAIERCDCRALIETAKGSLVLIKERGCITKRRACMRYFVAQANAAFLLLRFIGYCPRCGVQWLQQHLCTQNDEGFVHICRLDTRGAREIG